MWLQAVTLKVECNKLTCPPLSCSESEAYRPDAMACCKQCPSVALTTTTPVSALPVNKEMLLLDEEAQVRTEIDILSLGGCRFKGDIFENGEEWHPRIQPWGEMRCINCNCKVNSIKSELFFYLFFILLFYYYYINWIILLLHLFDYIVIIFS